MAVAQNRKAKIAVAVAVAAGLLWWMTREAKASTKKKKPGVCPPYDLDPGEVAERAEVAVTQGMTGRDRVAVHVASTMFPKDIDGKKIPWPTEAPWQFPPNTAEPILCLLAEIKLILGELPIPEDPEEPTVTPTDILDPLISDTPTPGSFFKIYKDGPNALGLNGITGQALATISAEAAGDGQTRLAYLKLMTTPDTWNWELYAATGNTTKWPSYTNVEGRNLRAAWLPRNKNAIAAIANGQTPSRNITTDGKKAGDGASYGLIWLPPISADALKNLGVISTEGTWDDGSSVLNPPPELLDLLT